MTEHRLLELKIEVNRNCPLNCLHCSSNGLLGAPERLSFVRLSELIREFSSMGGEKICISGGEPLCYEELPAVLDLCNKEKINVSLYSSGISISGGSRNPISDEITAFLAENSVRVIFSLHGASANTHDSLTGVQGSFNCTTGAIRKVVDAGVSAEVHTVPTSINFNELAAMPDLVSSLDVHKISWLRFVPQGRGWLNKDKLKLSGAQLCQLKTIKTGLQKVGQTVKVRTGAPFNILCSEEAASCDAGINMITINPNGTVFPCDAFKQFRLQDDFGNVLYHSLSEVWQKSYFLNSIRALQQSRFNSSCGSCSSYSRCNSGCIAQKAIAAGKVTDCRDPDCALIGNRGIGEQLQPSLSPNLV